ncbi:NAD-dependent epimerase/dehydratase family protein [Listeria aquatica]|uniref:NAD-dependent epimerase/dehydratase domain-containing protein n=1 Tax=Listeria aquatica FSL S10-1188 TaxID=1265818 RepID=W7B1S0_9LIST|nr:NAD-dependent epimerase/dehydratase family protein [Listeria aquatica]EUJ19370.1 hypothetical protein MAQA_07222 [Listeria aquatica FSL S10-1188]
MKILVFGGTRFFGKQLVKRLIESGHEVTIATRGKTRDPFQNQVKRVILDRRKRDDLFLLAASETYDVIYDDICYSPQDALYAVKAFQKSKPRLIFVSTLAVYPNKGRVLTEADFDSAHYEIVTGDRDDFDYGEGKKLAEAVYAQKAEFPVLSVRLPVVLGNEDYTKRMEFHLKRIEAGTEIGIQNEAAEIGFIHADEAARFLERAGTASEATGPINAASNGSITLGDLMQLFAEKLGKEAKIEAVTEDEDESPYDLEDSYFLSNDYAKSLGFQFESLSDWLPKLIENYVRQKDY